ncbi:MAG: hypothetical protein VX566_04000 [Candidatus Thermoplasmatota archaeon]|nr:hypothetical protein [Candidatus Thermoplasmatota archaeon]
MRIQNIVLSGLIGVAFFSGMAAADGGGHKEILPDETIIGISLACTLLTYFTVAKISGFSLDNVEKITAALIMFTIVVHAILGIDDLKLLAGAAGYLAFGVAFYVMEIPFVEKNRTIFSYLLIIYTLAIVVFYLYLHPDLTKNGSYDSVGILTKISEIGIIVLTAKKLS